MLLHSVKPLLLVAALPAPLPSYLVAMEGRKLGVALRGDCMFRHCGLIGYAASDAAEVGRITSVVTDGAKRRSLFVAKALFGRSLTRYGHVIRILPTGRLRLFLLSQSVAKLSVLLELGAY